MRQRPLERLLLFHLPLWFFLIVTLFPFFWMFVTSIKPNAELSPGALAISPHRMPLASKGPAVSHSTSSETSFRFTPGWLCVKWFSRGVARM